MFSYFRGSSTTTNSDNTATASAAPTEGSVKTPTNRPTAGAAYGGNDLPQEDARYADMVLLPNRRANEDTLIQLGGGKKKSGKRATKKELPPPADSNDTFDVVTNSAFDVVEIDGKKVPRYLARDSRANGEDWVVVSPKKEKIKA